MALFNTGLLYGLSSLGDSKDEELSRNTIGDRARIRNIRKVYGIEVTKVTGPHETGRMKGHGYWYASPGAITTSWSCSSFSCRRTGGDCSSVGGDRRSPYMLRTWSWPSPPVKFLRSLTVYDRNPKMLLKRPHRYSWATTPGGLWRRRTARSRCTFSWTHPAKTKKPTGLTPRTHDVIIGIMSVHAPDEFRQAVQTRPQKQIFPAW